MEIITIPLKDINPAAYNPRKDLQPGDPEYEKLKKSILEFDMVEPLIWNKKTGNLVGGHQRLKILKELGIENVEVSAVNLSPVKEKALNLALNKIEGAWDMPKLKDLLEELDTGDFDIEITGFDEKEIEDLMTQFHVPEEGLTDDDEIPEKVETICKSGNLWQLGEHRLLCGDATKKEDVERLMRGEKADMVFTDPPYGISIVKVRGKIGGSKPYTGKLGGEGGPTPYGGVAGKGRVGYSKLVQANDYFPVIGDDKPFDPLHLLKLAKHQIIFGANYFASKLPDGKAWLVWDKDASGSFSEIELIWTSFEGKLRLYRHMWSGLRREGLRAEEMRKRIHPTQKPVGLITQIIIDYKGTCIIDPYGGSGSTLIACEKLGRRCFMMEIAEYYCDVIIQRWQNFTGKQAVKIDG